MHALNSIIVLATEGGIPASSPWAKAAVPIGIVVFIGTVFMLLRSNLGTRRGYLVMSTSLWGFTFLLAIFWAFGAPGTPPNTGPQTLPGQELDEYQPIWVPVAQDSLAATQDGSPYSAIADYPAGWETAVPDSEASNAERGLTDITSFFGGLEDPYEALLSGTEAGTVVGYTTSDNGRPIIAAEFVPTCQFGSDGSLPAYCDGLELGDPVPADAVDANGNPVYEAPTTLFAFFDAGAPYFPSLAMMGLTFVLWAFHMVLLARDEKREREEARADEAATETVEVEDEKVAVSA